jgi:hypothetical protein
LNLGRTWRVSILALACLPTLLVSASDNGSAMAAQYHFVGSGGLAGNTNLPTLKRLAALPSTAAFGGLVMDEVSALLADQFHLEKGPSAKTLFRPLLSDLWRAESLGSFAQNHSNALHFVLAIRLDRAQAWHDHLAPAFGGPGEGFTAEGFSGWRWSRAGADLTPLSIISAKDWLIVGLGDDLRTLEEEYLKQIAQEGRPAPALLKNLLQADFDLAQLGPWLPPVVHLFKPARVHLAVSAKADRFDIAAHLAYAEPIPWTPQPWQIPTELIRSPLISLTAANNEAAFLNLDANFLRMEHNPLTNQYCAWALGQVAFQTYMEWPVPNASNALQALSSEAPQALNPELKRINNGEIIWLPDRRRLVLSKLGLVVPALEAAPAKNGEYLLFSLFPLSFDAIAAPQELWKQIQGRSDLVYYDWEATGPRLQQWRLLSQMLFYPPEARNAETLEATVLKENWLNSIGFPKANTVTEVTRVAPNELSLVRNAPLGFTGIEWILFSDWISRSQPR